MHICKIFAFRVQQLESQSSAFQFHYWLRNPSEELFSKERLVLEVRLDARERLWNDLTSSEELCAISEGNVRIKDPIRSTSLRMAHNNVKYFHTICFLSISKLLRNYEIGLRSSWKEGTRCLPLTTEDSKRRPYRSQFKSSHWMRCNQTVTRQFLAGIKEVACSNNFTDHGVKWSMSGIGFQNRTLFWNVIKGK